MKTLSLRVERQTANVGKIAVFLSMQECVEAVYYPGLPDAPGYEIAQSQMSGFGAMLSFEIKSTVGTAHEFMERLTLIKPAISLGGVETTICDPATTSHQKIAPDVRDRLGITDRLLRLSTGIEDADDLIADLAGAFTKAVC
jgi:cystathionine beta-lyase